MSRILIVDDEPDIINLISRYAKREGYRKIPHGYGDAVPKKKKKYLSVQIISLINKAVENYSVTH